MGLIRVIIHIIDVRRICGDVVEQLSHTVVRPLEHLDAATEIHLHLENLEDVEVKISAEIELLVAKVLGLVSVGGVQDAAAVEIVKIHVVAGVSGASVQDYPTIGVLAETLEGRVVPIHIRSGAVPVGGELIL